jgi:hypothetical protein
MPEGMVELNEAVLERITSLCVAPDVVGGVGIEVIAPVNEVTWRLPAPCSVDSA